MAPIDDANAPILGKRPILDRSAEDYLSGYMGPSGKWVSGVLERLDRYDNLDRWYWRIIGSLVLLHVLGFDNISKVRGFFGLP